ncbi:unnamed protein product, partial [Mycena citricolor]
NRGCGFTVKSPTWVSDWQNSPCKLHPLWRGILAGIVERLNSRSVVHPNRPYGDTNSLGLQSFLEPHFHDGRMLQLHQRCS